MTAKLKSSRLREEVANFAGYCMGSSYGDWDPRVDAIQEQVLEGGGRRFCSICGSCVSTTGGNSFESTTIIDEKDASRRTRRLSDEE